MTHFMGGLLIIIEHNFLALEQHAVGDIESKGFLFVFVVCVLYAIAI